MRPESRLGPGRTLLGMVVGLALMTAVGCGGSEPFELLPVKGKVVAKDASLSSAARIAVIFEPQTERLDPKTSPRPGYAEVVPSDGTFAAATSRKYGDGLVVGRHRVRVYCYDEDGRPSELQVTPSEITVGPDSTEFEFQVAKP